MRPALVVGTSTMALTARLTHPDWPPWQCNEALEGGEEVGECLAGAGAG